MNLTRISIALVTAFLCGISKAEVILVSLRPFEGSAQKFQEEAGIYQIRGPMTVLAAPASVPAGTTVLEFEYFGVGGVPSFAILPGPPYQAETARRLPAIEHREAWSSYAARIETAADPLPANWKNLRIDFPLLADQVLQIRKVRLRSERAGEFGEAQAKPSASASEAALESYFKQKFPGKIDKVSLGKDFVRIEGRTTPDSDGMLLSDIPMDVLVDDPGAWQTLIDLPLAADGSFLVDVPRRRQRDGRDYDRLTSRWQIVRRTGERIEAQSHARYADLLDCRSPELPPARPANQKGLGGWTPERLPGTDELAELGITAVTVNLLIHSLVSLTPEPDTVPFSWQGRTYHARTQVLEQHDATFREAAKHGAMVSVILLVANPAKSGEAVVKLLGHPDAVKDGIYAMPNVTSVEGISLYGAILNLMAERWTRPDGQYGRIHHWIIHNEVDAGWVWTNAGKKTAPVYMDLYQRSMRLVDLIARQYDPHARPFITLTHHWAEAGNANWYGSRRMIELLLRHTRAEGDFPWALAYHPYPQNLFNPRTWEDHQATFSFDTAKITPKNLEVLDAYMKQPALLERGKVRPVHLSENGFHSKDDSPKSLEDQAAGMAFAWKKIAVLSSIESWQYHNWIDNRSEGGLRLGLRRFPDEPGDPAGKKPIWYLYQALGTPREEEVAAPYLKTIGISSWEEIRHQQAIR